MASGASAAVRALLKRLASDWLILVAAVATIGLATVLLASGPVYADSVTLAALQGTVANATVEEANILVEQRVPPGEHETVDRLITAGVEEAISTIGGLIYRHAEAESFGLPVASAGDQPDLVSFQYFEAIREHASLVDGEWPSAAAGTEVQSTILESTSAATGIRVGDTVTVTNRRDETLEVDVRIVGIYEVDDASDPFWFEDGLAANGTVESTFRTVGPFVVSFESLVSQLSPLRLTATWRVFPSFENLTVADVGELRASVGRLEQSLNDAYAATVGTDTGASDITVTTGLPDLLGDTERSLSVTRSSVLALLIQLAILAGYALALTAGLLVGVRRAETHLLRARGASPAQMGGVATMEGLVLTVPVALLSPWLASRAIELLNRYGPLSTIGLVIDPTPNTESYVLSFMAALGAVVALAWPAYRAARRFPDSGYEQRAEGRWAAQRAGADIALLALLVLVLWQLQTLGPNVSATIQGRFGVDPLLLVAPALGLLTGAILALRMVPLLGALAERIAASGRRLIAALASWQVARRPKRYARSALLLIMAVGIGFFAASFSTTWLQSQRDQAEYQVGADVRVLPNRKTNASTDDIFLPVAHESVDGIDTSMPLVRRNTQLPQTDSRTQLLLIDAEKTPSVARVREDLVPDLDELMEDLAQARPSLSTIELPGEPSGLALALGATYELGVPPQYLGPDPDAGFELRALAVVQDGDGLLHTLPLGSIPVNVGTAQLRVDLNPQTNGGPDLAPRYPLSLVDVQILSPVPVFSKDVSVEFAGVLVSDGSGNWTRVDARLERASWELAMSTLPALASGPDVGYSEDQPSNGLGIDITTGAALSAISPPLYYSIRPRGTELPSNFPILVTERLLEANALSIGDTFRLPALTSAESATQIAGVVNQFPTVDSETTDVILADRATVQMMAHGPGVQAADVSEYWLAAHGDVYSVEMALLEEPFESVSVESVEKRSAELSSDPVALGTVGALSLGFVAAAVFATVGFAVSATVSARERVKEFALLRALGLSPRQLGGWLSLEQGALVIVSLLLGTLVGALLTLVLLPLVSLTQTGTQTVPEVIIIFPWQSVLGLELAVVAILAVTVIGMTLLVRRQGLGSVLRVGDD